ncbi:hypothetical protein EJ07DRAFT_158104 [Lizonia empirigonia]|nr:hypothetical protein EJ07DRAFT_158104 [Lizonia empirigonia]
MTGPSSGEAILEGTWRCNCAPAQPRKPNENPLVTRAADAGAARPKRSGYKRPASLCRVRQRPGARVHKHTKCRKRPREIYTQIARTTSESHCLGSMNVARLASLLLEAYTTSAQKLGYACISSPVKVRSSFASSHGNTGLKEASAVKARGTTLTGHPSAHPARRRCKHLFPLLDSPRNNMNSENSE